jgi:hypothetical protein
VGVARHDQVVSGRVSLAVAVTWLLASCAAPSSTETVAAPATPVAVTSAPIPTPSPTPSTSPAEERLSRLTIAPRPYPDGTYSRRAFGNSWVDVDGNGCNQRDDVLLRDAVRGTVKVEWQGRCDHDVIAGTWVDPYTGRTLLFDNLKDMRQAQAIQIDHIVPLSEAWASGANAWSDDRRKQFANDLDELVAVDGPTNESKSDGDPAAWRPRKGYQCTYAKRWIEVKTKWALSIDDSERRALEQMLGYC